MSIDIGNLKLSKIHKMETLENANYVYHTVPGLEGSISQDLGRSSVRLSIEGIFYGTTAKDDMKKLREIYKKRDPVDFIADIVEQAYVGKVILESFGVKEDANDPEQFSYTLIVSEYVKPPSATMGMTSFGLDSVNQMIGVDAGALMELSSLTDMLALGSIPELTNPLEPLDGSLGPIQNAVGGLSESMNGLTKLFGE